MLRYPSLVINGFCLRSRAVAIWLVLDTLLESYLIESISCPLVDNIDVSSTANLYKSLAQAAPEIKQCVDACNFIAESTKQQNDIGSVSMSTACNLG